MCILGGFSVALQLCLLDFVCPVACPFQINSKNQKHQRTSVASWPWQVFQPSVPGTVPNITRGNSDSIICRLTITENSKFWDCAYFWSTNLLGVRSTRISTWPQAVQACALSLCYQLPLLVKFVWNYIWNKRFTHCSQQSERHVNPILVIKLWLYQEAQIDLGTYLSRADKQRQVCAAMALFVSRPL